MNKLEAIGIEQLRTSILTIQEYVKAPVNDKDATQNTKWEADRALKIIEALQENDDE